MVFLVMAMRKFRQLAVLLLALSLALGFLAHSFGSSDTGRKMAVIATADLVTLAKCGSCDNNHDSVPSAACFAHCSSAAIMPLATVVLNGRLADIRDNSAVSIVTGQRVSPEPYPPRPIVLS